MHLVTPLRNFMTKKKSKASAEQLQAPVDLEGATTPCLHAVIPEIRGLLSSTQSWKFPNNLRKHQNCFRQFFFIIYDAIHDKMGIFLGSHYKLHVSKTQLMT